MLSANIVGEWLRSRGLRMIVTPVLKSIQSSLLLRHEPKLCSSSLAAQTQSKRFVLLETKASRLPSKLP